MLSSTRLKHVSVIEIKVQV